MNDMCDDIDIQAATYNKVLEELINKHAPMKTKVVHDKPTVPWHNEEIANSRRERRKAERQYRRKKSEITSVISTAKSEFFRKSIEEAGHDQKALYKIVNTLLHRKHN